MANLSARDCFTLPLGLKPEIHQAGLGEHGVRKKESFIRPKLWALHLYFWDGQLDIGGRAFEIHPRNIGLTPPATKLTWHHPLKPCRHYFVHFTFPDKLGKNPAIEVPAMYPLGIRFEQFHQPFGMLVKWSATNSLRAEIILWEMLWRLTDLIRPATPMLTIRPGPVETALGIIENELDQSFNAKSLAQRVALSYSQLNRLFKEHFSVSLAQYIVNERFKRADTLLRESNLPIKAIAEQLGLSDLQHFNKFIRSRTGLPPRAFREANLVGALQGPDFFVRYRKGSVHPSGII